MNELDINLPYETVDTGGWDGQIAVVEGEEGYMGYMVKGGNLYGFIIQNGSIGNVNCINEGGWNSPFAVDLQHWIYEVSGDYLIAYRVRGFNLDTDSKRTVNTGGWSGALIDAWDDRIYKWNSEHLYGAPMQEDRRSLDGSLVAITAPARSVGYGPGPIARPAGADFAVDDGHVYLVTPTNTLCGGRLDRGGLRLSDRLRNVDTRADYGNTGIDVI